MDSRTRGGGRASSKSNGGSQPLGHVAPRRQQERSPKEVWSLRIRLVVTAVLVVTAFVAAPFVAVRSVDPPW